MREKILIVGPCLSMGGMERASVNTANSIHNFGFTETVFLSILKKEHFFTLNDNLRLIEPIGFNVKRISLVKTLFWLRGIVKNEKPDRILVFNKFYAAMVGISLLGTDIPFFISERSSPLFNWKLSIRIFNRVAFLLKSPTGVIAQTSIAARFQREYYKNSVVKVIPNMVRHLTHYPHIERGKIILAVGRLGDYLKGFDLLIRSFSLLKSLDWELNIAGDDENGEFLKDLSLQFKIADRVKFLGKIQNMDPIYANAGIYVITSRSEGFPNALAEAMTAGCCCVSFDFVAGPRDMIKNNLNGVIVENGDCEKMAEVLDRLINDETTREKLGEEAKKLAVSLNAGKITTEILDFLKM